MEEPKGITYLKDFLSLDEHDKLLEFLDSQPWNGVGVEPNSELKRRTQQYGRLFLFKTRELVGKEFTEIPKEFQVIIQRMQELGLVETSQPINHIVVNEYQKGQG